MDFVHHFVQNFSCWELLPAPGVAEEDLLLGTYFGTLSLSMRGAWSGSALWRTSGKVVVDLEKQVDESDKNPEIVHDVHGI